MPMKTASNCEDINLQLYVRATKKTQRAPPQSDKVENRSWVLYLYDVVSIKFIICTYILFLCI